MNLHFFKVANLIRKKYLSESSLEDLATLGCG